MPPIPPRYKKLSRRCTAYFQPSHTDCSASPTPRAGCLREPSPTPWNTIRLAQSPSSWMVTTKCQSPILPKPSGCQINRNTTLSSSKPATWPESKWHTVYATSRTACSPPPQRSSRRVFWSATKKISKNFSQILPMCPDRHILLRSLEQSIGSSTVRHGIGSEPRPTRFVSRRSRSDCPTWQPCLKPGKHPALRQKPCAHVFRLERIPSGRNRARRIPTN